MLMYGRAPAQGSPSSIKEKIEQRPKIPTYPRILHRRLSTGNLLYKSKRIMRICVFYHYKICTQAKYRCNLDYKRMFLGIAQVVRHVNPRNNP